MRLPNGPPRLLPDVDALVKSVPDVVLVPLAPNILGAAKMSPIRSPPPLEEGVDMIFDAVVEVLLVVRSGTDEVLNVLLVLVGLLPPSNLLSNVDKVGASSAPPSLAVGINFGE